MAGCSDILDIPPPRRFLGGYAPKPPFSLRSFSNCTRSAIERSENGSLGGNPQERERGLVDPIVIARLYCTLPVLYVVLDRPDDLDLRSLGRSNAFFNMPDTSHSRCNRQTYSVLRRPDAID